MAYIVRDEHKFVADRQGKRRIGKALEMVSVLSSGPKMWTKNARDLDVSPFMTIVAVAAASRCPTCWKFTQAKRASASFLR